MQSTEKTPDDYVASIPADRQEIVNELRRTIRKNLPKGFSEEMNYGMIGYVVPHKLYPAGYHCDPKLPLPFMAVASQKNFIAIYHMGIYADDKLMKWFTTEFPKHSKSKLDMGKSCIRFKKINEIPVKLIGELAAKMTPKEWITLYESKFRQKK